MRIYKILFLVTMVIFSSCRKDEIFDTVDSEIEIPQPENIDNNLINGTINDDAFNPLSDVTVMLYSDNVLIEETKTSTDGKFYFIIDEIKEYLIYIESDTYQQVLTSVNPSENINDITVNLQLDTGGDIGWDVSSYEWISVEGRILNDDGTPSAFTNILFIDFAGVFFNYITTDNEGYYRSIIPADVYIFFVVEQECNSEFANDYILANDDVVLDDIILINEVGTTSISGNVVDCNNVPIVSGEITFYEESNFPGDTTQNIILATALISNGVFQTDVHNICSAQIYYIAVAYQSGDQVYGEIYDLNNLVIEEIEICNSFDEGGTINVTIDNIMSTMDGQFAFENYDRISVFKFMGGDSAIFEFESNRTEGTYNIDQLFIQIGEKIFSPFDIQLEVSITEYPQSNQENLVGQIEGEIYDLSDQQKLPFTLDFNIPLF